MTFKRIWDYDEERYVIDRELTGPPKPVPETGTIRAADGAIVADSTTVSIPPPTPIEVKFPGPREPVLDGNGNMTPRWYRFYKELYLRTGGPVDNINRVPTTTIGSGVTPTELTLAGAAPSVEIDHFRAVGVGTLSVSPTTPAPDESSPTRSPSTASITVTGAAPTIS
jgi:hypothetical protein